MRTIKAKIVTLAIVSAFIVASTLAVVFIIVLQNSASEQVAALETSLRDDFDRLVKSEVETAATMLARLTALRLLRR